MLGIPGDLAVDPQMRHLVGIVHPGQPEHPLDALQQLQIDPGAVADLPRRDVVTVIAEHAARGQQHRHIGLPDLLDGHPLLEQPRDEFGTLGPGLALQPVEQAR
jgi:hypothetical protein